jgi:hypothetical protein
VTRRRKTWIGWCLAIAAVALLPKEGLAGDASQGNAKWYVEQAQLYADMGRWDAALADYEAAYAVSRDPGLLLKMGDVCQRKGDLKRAIDCYRNYLEKVPNASDRLAVQKRILELEERVKNPAPAPGVPATEAPSVAAPPPNRPSAAKAPPPPGPPVAAGASVPTAETAQPTPVAEQSVAEQPLEEVSPTPPTTAPELLPPLRPNVEPSPAVPPSAAPVPAFPPPTSSAAPPQVPAVQSADVSVRSDQQAGWGGRRIAGGVLMGSGIVVVGVGGIFSWRTKSIESSINSSSSFDSGEYRDGQTAEVLQWVCYGVGGAAAITGLILYLTAPSSSSRLSFAPQVGPRGAGLTAQGVF